MIGCFAVSNLDKFKLHFFRLFIRQMTYGREVAGCSFVEEGDGIEPLTLRLLQFSRLFREPTLAPSSTALISL